MKVCLVTEEVASSGVSGGIGGAMEELAQLLARRGAEVDVLCCVGPSGEDVRKNTRERFERRGIRLQYVDDKRYTWDDSFAGRSYSVYRALIELEKDYDVIHFHEYHGIGAVAVNTKRQGIAFHNTQIVVQCHGPLEWCLECNGELATEPAHLEAAYLERESIAGADYLISPSAYLFEWMKEHDYLMPEEARRLVIQNVCTSLISDLGTSEGGYTHYPVVTGVNEIVMFGRHESRKGFVAFVDAVCKVHHELAQAGVTVTFLGRFGKVLGQHSGSYLAKASVNWECDVRILPGMGRNDANAYLRSNPHSVPVVPSPAENSPYTVLELLALGKALITSTGGGARELIADEYHEDCLVDISPTNLAGKILQVIEEGAVIPSAARSFHDTEEDWVAFHDRLVEAARSGNGRRMVPTALPRVVLGITHHERPEKLIDSVVSAMRQTYSNLEIVVYDDGSTSEETQAALASMETFLARGEVRLIRGDNRYLGGARNAIARQTESEFLCFLDDDDVAHPRLIEELVNAVLASGADVMNCLNVFMPEKRRAEMLRSVEAFDEIPSYIPMGGPLELAPLKNVFGAATALISRSVFNAVGGYTELRGVGHEDYELFTRICQEGGRIEVLPLVLYLYEVDRPSMISRTSTMANFKRVLDSFDFSRNAVQWSRMISMITGKEAEAQELNRREWESRRDGFAEWDGPLMRGELSLEEQLCLLEGLCSRLENETLARAFAQALRYDWNLGTDETGHVVARVRRARATRAPGKGAFVQAKLLLLQGEVDAALEHVLMVVDSLWGVPQSAWLILEEIVDSRRLSYDRLIALREGLDSWSVPDQYALHWFTLEFGVAQQLADGNMMASVLMWCAEVDEHDYLMTNRDVAAAVSDGVWKSGFHHYLKRGAKEHRGGFPTFVKVLASATEEPVGMPVDHADAIAAVWRAVKEGDLKR